MGVHAWGVLRVCRLGLLPQTPLVWPRRRLPPPPPPAGTPSSSGVAAHPTGPWLERHTMPLLHRAPLGLFPTTLFTARSPG